MEILFSMSAIALSILIISLLVVTGAWIAALVLYRRKTRDLEEELTRLKIDSASVGERLSASQVKGEALTEESERLRKAVADGQSALVQAREENVRLQTSAKEQRQHAEEKLKLLTEARESMQNGFKNLANEIFESKQKEFKNQSKEQLSGVLDPLHERIKSFEKRVEDTYSNEAKERYSLQKEVKNLQELNVRIAQDAVNLTNALVVQPFFPTMLSWQNKGFACEVFLPNRQYELAVVCCTRSREQTVDLIAQAAAQADYVVVDGQKVDGIDSHYRMLRKLVKVEGNVIKGHGRLFWFLSKDLSHLRAEHKKLNQYTTVAGVFSAGSVDKGSELLAEALPKTLNVLSDQIPKLKKKGYKFEFVSNMLH